MSDLYSRLVSRLKERFASVGSMEFKQTWKVRVTPSGLSYWAHTAVGHRTSASAFSSSPSATTPPPSSPNEPASWPTPDTGSAAGRVSANPGQAIRPSGTKCQLTLNDAAALAVPEMTSWPTPDAGGFGVSDSNWEERRAALAEKYGNNGFGMTLGMAVTLAGWNTPRATDGENGGPNQSGGALPADAAGTMPVGWATPRATDIGRCRSEEAIARAREKGGSSSLEDDAQLAGWATPDANSGSGGLQADPEAALARLKTGRSNLDDMVHTAGWPTTRAEDATKGQVTTQDRPGGVGHDLPTVVGWATPRAEERVQQNSRDDYQALSKQVETTAGWPTPMAGSPATESYNEAGNTDSSRKTVELVGWPTPQCPAPHDSVESAGRPRPHRIGNDKYGLELPEAAWLAAMGPPVPTVLPWATPSARDFKSESATAEFNAQRDDHPRGKPLSYQVTQTSGPPTTSSTAATTSGGGSRRGVLNPYFSAWLMGYSTAWVEAGLRAAATVKARSRSRSRKSKAVPQS